MPPPSRLGKYEIRREIGKGSMGVVYEGFDPLIERRVAVKVVRPDELEGGQMPELLARLRREAQAAGRLNHPGIVAIYDYGEDSTLHGSHVAYIAMELVDSGDLRARLDAGHRFPVTEIVRLMSGILAALRHAHERGVTHRDIKPGNVMLLPDGSVKIADFGIAHLENSDLTRAGTVVGTPQYMAPEQLLGLAVDGRADLFACGVILYQLLTGSKPFSGSYATVVQKVLNEEPPPPTSVNQSLAPAWDQVVRKAMAKKPADRYQTAAEFAAAVARAAAAGSDETTVLMPAPAAAGSPRWQRSIGITTGVLLGAAALGGYFLWPRQGPSASTASAPAVAPSSPTPTRASDPAPSTQPLAAGATATAPSIQAASATALRVASAPILAAAVPRPASAPVKSPAVPTPGSTEPKPAAQPFAATPAPPDTRPLALPRSAGRAESPAPAVAPADEWRVRRTAAETPRGRSNLAAALNALLDLSRDEDRRRVAEFDALMRQMTPHCALVMGTSDGHIVAAVRPGQTVDLATRSAQARCRELRAAVCSTVQIDGEFHPARFAAMSTELGSRSVGEVRAAFLRNLDRGLDAMRAAIAAAAGAGLGAPASVAGVAEAGATSPRAAPPSPPAPSSAPAVPPSAREWADARAALRAASGRLSLASALGLLLDARSSNETDTFARFETAMKRLQWKSALALGEKNGHVQWGWRSREPNTTWAAENAISACNRVSSAPCVVVMADGKFNEAGFLDFASRLGARPQAPVRDSLVHAMQRRLDAGGP